MDFTEMKHLAVEASNDDLSLPEEQALAAFKKIISVYDVVSAVWEDDRKPDRTGRMLIKGADHLEGRTAVIILGTGSLFAEGLASCPTSVPQGMASCE